MAKELILKLTLILLNIILIAVFFAFKWFSVSVFLTFMLLYQLYVYTILKKIKNISYFNKRSIVASSILYIIVIAIISRAINLQIFNNDYYKQIEYNQISSNYIKSGKRGTILDANMKKMAFNTNVYNIIIDPKRAQGNKKINEVLIKLKEKGIIESNLVSLEKELAALADKKSRYKVIAKKIDENEKIIVTNILNDYKLKENEIFFDKILERKYFKSSNYLNIVGNVGYPKDEKGLKKIGVFGVEKYYNEYLTEKYHTVKTKLTKNREIQIPTSEEVIENSLNGKNVVLTIDTDINFILNIELEKQYLATKAEEAYAVVMNPNNGKIIATSYFTNNKKDLRNPIFQDQFEPGSTFKPLIIAAALEEKYITPYTKFDIGDGKITRYNHTIKEASKSTVGVLDTGDIINKSSNVGMVLVSDYFTNEKFEEYLKKYGFYDKTGVDFPSELKPYASPYQKWDKLKKNTMAFGQGVAVTPIQLITAFSAIINGGTMYKPYIVDRIEDQEGTVIRRNVPKKIRKVISEDVSEKIKKMLEDNIQEGSGKKAIVNGYRIGGKTGTAQLSAPGGGYLKGEYLSSFLGVFPIEKPEYVVLIMVLKPQSDSIYGRYGSSVAAPVFGEVVARVTSSKGIASSNVKSFSTYKDNENLEKDEDSKEQELLKKEIMPNLAGKDMKDILEIFSGSRFKLDVKGNGVVKKQSPSPEGNLSEVEKIVIELE